MNYKDVVNVIKNDYSATYTVYDGITNSYKKLPAIAVQPVTSSVGGINTKGLNHLDAMEVGIHIVLPIQNGSACETGDAIDTLAHELSMVLQAEKTPVEHMPYLANNVKAWGGVFTIKKKRR